MNQYQVKVDYNYDDNNGISFSSSLFYISLSENENDAITNIQNILNENSTITHLRYNGEKYEINKNLGIVSTATQISI